MKITVNDKVTIGFLKLFILYLTFMRKTKQDEIFINILFRFQIPRPFAMFITSLQLLQMVVGCSINYMAYGYKESGQSTYGRIGVMMGIVEMIIRLVIIMVVMVINIMFVIKMI